MQGHSTASSLPHLPEAGPTSETMAQEDLHVPATKPASAHTTPVENLEVEAGDEVNQRATEVAADSEEILNTRKAKRLRLASDSPSEASDEHGQAGTRNSGTHSPSKSIPLAASPLASRPPPPSGSAPFLGALALDEEPESDDEESRFVLSK